MKTYTLTTEGKKFAEIAKPETHAGAVVLAVKKLKKGTAAEILVEVEKAKLDTKMDMRKAVSFMLFDLGRRRRILRATE
jgi:hypothetical protein